MSLGLDRTVRILDLFTSDVPEWSVSDACRALDLPKSTVWESLRDMSEVGLLRRVGRGRYRLGWRSFQLGLRARMTSEISVPAWESMRGLVEAHHETMHLASRYRDQVVYLEKIAPPGGVRVHVTRVGERVPAHCTAAGKVLLAHLSTTEVDTLHPVEPLPSLTPHSITGRAALTEELSRAREHGHALDVQEAVMGMCCVAAPITNSHGDIAWAMSMSFPAKRLGTHRERYTQAVTEAAQHLSDLGD